MPSSKTTTSITKPNNALAKAVQPDAALSAVVGSAPLPRTELTKKIWEYIRKHELQDPKKKTNINADEKLLSVFGGRKQVTMFEMTKFVNQHLLQG
jgi:chromatin remodeling complex protein RSC6